MDKPALSRIRQNLSLFLVFSHLIRNSAVMIEMFRNYSIFPPLLRKLSVDFREKYLPIFTAGVVFEEKRRSRK